MSERINDPGFGAKYERKTKRIINHDGSFNVRRKGVDTGLRSLYEALIGMKLLPFLGVVLATYLLLNAFFATLYFLNGVEHLQGATPNSLFDEWLTCFFFSFQTFTTVGYGFLSPMGMTANFIAAVEALCGLLGFALATGLLYGRFSKPRAKLIYSKNALMSPFKDGKALMFRVANKRSNVLMQMEATVILMLKDDPMIPHQRSYYRLDLQVSRIHFLPLSWTIVHPVTEESPFFGKTPEELIKKEAELLILITGFDDTFNQIVHSRFSYTCEEFVHDAKFKIPYEIDTAGDIVLDIEDINAYKLTNTA